MRKEMKSDMKHSISDSGEALWVGPVFSGKPYGYHTVLRQLSRRLSSIWSATVSVCLAFGRPRGLNRPKGYYLAMFFAKHHSGVVVDPFEGDPATEGCINDAMLFGMSIRGAYLNTLPQTQKFEADCLSRKFASAVTETVLTFERSI